MNRIRNTLIVFKLIPRISFQIVVIKRKIRSGITTYIKIDFHLYIINLPYLSANFDYHKIFPIYIVKQINPNTTNVVNTVIDVQVN